MMIQAIGKPICSSTTAPWPRRSKNARRGRWIDPALAEEGMGSLRTKSHAWQPEMSREYCYEQMASVPAQTIESILP